MSRARRVVSLFCVCIAIAVALGACNSGVHEGPGMAASQVLGDCTSNGTCTGGQVCDPITAHCVNCNPAADLCSNGQYCAFPRCAPGCKNSTDCSATAKTCDVTSHTCFECLADQDCGAGLRCAGRICVPGCSTTSPCATGKACCDGACVDLGNNMDNCAACGTKCTAPSNGIPACVNSACTYACVAGFSDCNGNKADGCEADTRLDPARCGSCSNQCPSPANAGAGCAQSACTFPCNAGYSDCNGSATDGCEIHSAVDKQNCGGCGIKCIEGSSQTAACVGGSCNKNCLSGFADCDGDAANGCESNLANVSTCGSCGNKCIPTNPWQVSTCSQGTCLSCESYMKDCDGNPANGCEVNLRDVNNCGTCGNKCPVFPHTIPVCNVDGTCSSKCQTNAPSGDVDRWADCDGNPNNGCETSLETIQNCGTCGHVCSTAGTTSGPYATQCYGVSSCLPACAPGYADCDGNPDNGCEKLYNLSRDADGDGHGARWDHTHPENTKYQTCQRPGSGWVENDDDCLDSNPNVYGGQTGWFRENVYGIVPTFDYSCNSKVEGSWGKEACVNGSVPGAYYMCPADYVAGHCTWNGSSCDFKAGWLPIDGYAGLPSCKNQPPYIVGCYQNGSSCSTAYAAGGEWGCH